MKYLIIFPLFFVGSFLWYFKGNSTNHTGMEFLLFMWLSIICAGIAAHQVIKTKKPLFIIPFILNLSAASFFYYIDHNNIMVQYDRWIYRGMPEPYEASKQKPKSDIPKKLQEYSSSITMKRKKGEITDEEVTRMIDHYISEVDKIRAQKKAENKDQTTPSE